MSAFIALVREDRIEIVSDGANYDLSGRMMAVTEKVRVFPDIPMAIWGRGSNTIVNGAAAMVKTLGPLYGLIEQNTFDEAAKRLESVFATRLKSRIGDEMPDGCHSEVFMAGFSEHLGHPVIVCMRTFAWEGGDGSQFEPWKVYMMPSPWFGGPLIAAEVAKELYGSPNKFESIGLEPHAVQLMQTMREQKDINPTAPHLPPMHGVGGHVQFVSVSRDSVDSRIIHCWDDPIGEVIEPFRDREDITLLSRQRRRALERQAVKKVRVVA